jgi:hypothetical protein
MAAMPSRCAAVACLASVVGAAWSGFACASSPDRERLVPVPEYVRPASAWTPEELHRDLIRCLDASHASVLAELGGSRASLRAVRNAMRDRTSECMAVWGWVPRVAMRSPQENRR